MKHLIFAPEQTQYDIAILIKDAHFNQNELNNHYVQPLKQAGIAENKIIAFSLPYDKKKVSNAQIRAYLTQFTLIVNKLGIKYIYCADAEYFKVLTKQTKTDACFGYFFESTLPTTNPVQVVIGLNHAGLVYNPGQLPKLTLSIQTLADLYCGKYQALGLNIIKSAHYPTTVTDIALFLDSLHTHKSLTCDIEAFSLNAFEAGIGSIAFAWDKHSGGAFLVDFKTTDVAVGYYGRKQKNMPVRLLLQQFFKQYKGNLKFHNATYDVKVLILELFMAHSQDYKGMLQGLELLTANMDDTKIIAYLALNTTAELSLGLKSLSHEYAGNYAQDEINDIRRIHPTELLKYNLMDCLSTWYVYDKYYPVVVADNQQNIYDTLMRPSLKILIQIELVGMPIDLNRVKEVEAQLVSIQNTHIASLSRSAVIQDCQKVLQLKELTAINSKLKTKQHGMDKVADYTFNPNSNQHLNELLYSVMQLPVLDRTPSKQPSTGAATLEKLLNHTTNQDYIDVLNALIGLSKVDKILTAFIPSFLKAEVKRKGAWLHGSFNLGGTVSGRLSSCVAEWTEVATQRGMIPISQLRIGDLVWTHKRRWQPVLDVIIKPVTPMVDITFCNGYTLTCTTAHKLRLPNGEWKTVQEIIDERIENVDSEPRERIGNSCSVQSRPSNNACRDSYTTQYDQSQHHPYSQNTHAVSRVCSEESPQIFNVERGRQESYEGQDGGATSQVGGGMFRSEGLSDNASQWGTSVCSPSSDGTGFGIDQTTRPIRGASCGQQSTEQLIGQFGFSDKPSTSHDSLTTGNQCYGKIKEINPRGNLQVWDITVAEDHSYWAQGCFNHNSSPNLQNIPSGSIYGKLIKSCFKAEPGWVFAGADFNALEDKINTVLTKDPNKVKVWVDGYDSHCYRAYYYWREKMPDIVDTVESINSIKKKYDSLRSLSKRPSFALQYAGTYITLMNQCGFSEAEAKQIEANYHKMYAASDQWVQQQLDLCCKQGYIDVAFGLRIRTPLLAKSILGNSKTLTEAQAEARSVSNAISGQSYGLLNNRAAIAFMERVWASEHRYSVFLVSLIHDAIYLIVKDDIEVVTWVNKTLTEEMAWQELPEIQHPQVKLSAELDVFYNGWHQPITLPNRATKQEILEICKAGVEKYNSK